MWGMRPPAAKANDAATSVNLTGRTNFDETNDGGV